MRTYKGTIYSEMHNHGRRSSGSQDGAARDNLDDV